MTVPKCKRLSLRSKNYHFSWFFYLVSRGSLDLQILLGAHRLMIEVPTVAILVSETTSRRSSLLSSVPHGVASLCGYSDSLSTRRPREHQE